MIGWQNFLFVGLVAAAATIAAAELTARYLGFGDPPVVILDETLEYYLAPSRSYKRFGHTIRVNRYGMRSDDVDLASVDRRAIFSVFGDSIVYGQRLDQGNTLQAQLQQLLRSNSESQGAIVNSIAAASWGPENLLEYYKRFGPLPGRTAWIVQSSHDMVDVTLPPEGTPVPHATISPHGALHDIALAIWRRVGGHRPSRRDDALTHEEARRRADVALHALIDALKVDYERVVIVFHATRDETLGGKAEAQAHYQAFAREHAIEFTSTLDLYGRRAYDSNSAAHIDDIHLSADGARTLAQRLAADAD